MSYLIPSSAIGGAFRAAMSPSILATCDGLITT